MPLDIIAKPQKLYDVYGEKFIIFFYKQIIMNYQSVQKLIFLKHLMLEECIHKFS